MSNGFFVTGMIVIVFIFGFSVFMHEQVHLINNDRVGVQSELKLALYDGWMPAVGVQRTGLPEREISNYEMVHLQNEIINYNLLPSLIGIMAMLLFGFLYIGEKIGSVKQ